MLVATEAVILGRNASGRPASAFCKSIDSQSPNPDLADAADQEAASATAIAMWKATDAVLVLLILAIGGLPRTASAQVPDSVRQAALQDFHGNDLTGKDGPLAKAGMDLLILYHARSTTNLGAGQTPGAPSATPGEPGGTGALEGMQVRDGRVAVEAMAAGDPEVLVQDLEGLGATRVQRAGPLVSAQLPISRIPDLARLASLNQARQAQSTTGAVTGATTGEQPIAPSPPSSAREDASSPDEASPADPPSTDEPAGPGDAPDAQSAASSSGNDRIDAAAPSMEEMRGASDRMSSKSSKDAGALLLIALAVTIVLFLDP